jgi:hypothetical protein
MKRIKLYEEFIESLKEEAMTPKDSKVTVDDYTCDSGLEIKSTEIVGAMVSCESEDEFLDYFYNQYSMTAFTEADIASLVKYFNDYLEEVTAKETEEEEAKKKEEEGGDDPLAGL